MHLRQTIRQSRLFLFLLGLTLALNAFTVSGLTGEGPLPGSSQTASVSDRRIWEQVAEPLVPVTDDWTISAYELHVPRIELPGDAAFDFNAGMDVLETDLLSEFQASVTENRPYAPYAEYTVYDDGEILSVLVRVIWNAEWIEYYPVTLDNKTGTALDTALLAERFGITDDLFAILEDTVRAASLDMGAPAPIEAAMMEDLWQYVENDEVKLFVDEVGRLSLLLISYDPAAGAFETPYPLAMPRGDRALNPVFLRVANQLGLNAEEIDDAGFAAYLGSGFSDATLDLVMKRLWAFAADYSEYRLPALLDNSVETESGFYLAGNEFYLFIPKYENTVIRLTQMMLTDAGELVPVDPAAGEAAVGFAFTAGNISEVYSNMEITYAFRDETVAFRPYISMKDGNAQFGDSVADITHLLLESPGDADQMPYELRDFIRERLFVFEP